MDQAFLSLLARWNGFYVIAGSASAALTGLQFVVVVLGAQVALGSEETNRAFGTPTIVHFCAVLLVSAIMSAPWPSLASAALAFGVCGSVGFVYALMVFRHMRRQKAYAPVLEDWAWHVVLPVAAYGGLCGASVAVSSRPAASLFVVGAASLLLLFVGIHNAWDSVTFIAVFRRTRLEGSAGRDREPMERPERDRDPDPDRDPASSVSRGAERLR